jgi:hypothetical protein
VKNFWELLKLVFRLSLANSRSKTWTALVLVTAGQLGMPMIAVALRFFINDMLAGDQRANSGCTMPSCMMTASTLRSTVCRQPVTADRRRRLPAR